MEIILNERLRALRIQKGVTQETLANHLSITPQSVGKWERGEGFPDITLLPKIAFYFGVTVDDLLGVDNLKVEEAIENYLQTSKKYKQNGDNAKNLELWEKAYSEFPNDCRVIESLMSAINRDAYYPCPPDKADRIIALAEELLQKSTDANQRESAIQELCYIYIGMGNVEKALHYADMGGNFFVTRKGLRASVLEGEEGIKACQDFILCMVVMINITVLSMTKKFKDGSSKEFIFTSEESIEAYHFAIDIMKRLFSDGNYGFHATDLATAYFNITREYALIHDKVKCLESLSEACNYAVLDATREDQAYTAPMVNRLSHNISDFSKNYKGNSCDLLLKELDSGIYDFIREEESFKELVKMFKLHAEG